MPKGIYDRTPEVSAAAAENLRRVRVASGWPASAHASEKQAARVSPEDRAQRWPNWRAAHPEQAAQANTNAGLASTAIVWRCDDADCQRVIYGPSIGIHQRATGHTGRTRIDNTTEETA